MQHVQAAAEDSFEQVDTESVAAAKGNLQKAIDYLESCLSQNVKHGPAWRAYLRLDDLASQLNAAQPDLEVLKDIQRQFESGHAGLKSPAFGGVSKNLTAYCLAVAAARIEDQPTVLRGEFQRLAMALEEVETRPRRRTFEQIGESLAWFDRHGFAPELMQEVRRLYVQPNFYAHVSADLLAAGFERPLRREIPINNTSGGARITGSGVFDGKMTLELVPDANQASFRLGFEGVLHSSTRGHRDPIGFSSRGVTTLTGERFITATAEGITASAANLSADTSLSITNVWSSYSRPVKDRIATKVGRKRVLEGKASSERRFSQKAEQIFAQAFSAETDKIVAEANQSLTNAFRVPLKKDDIYPRELSFSTTERHLHIQASQAGPGQLAAFAPPSQSYPWAAMTFSVHESLINNTTATALSGEEVESQQLASIIERIAGSVPEKFSSHDGTTWSLTLYKSAPVEVHFAEGGLTIKIRCSRIAAGEQQYNVPFEVSANYLGSIRGDAIVFSREGDVVLQSPGLNALGPLNDKQARSQAAIQERFEMLLSQEMAFTAAQLPFELPPGIELVPSEYLSGDGWMTVAFEAHFAKN